LILDTEVPWFEVWQQTFADFGVTLAFEIYARVIGTSVDAFHPMDHLEATLGRAVDRDAVLSKQRKRYAELIAGQRMLPGVLSLLDAASERGFGVAVASSSSRTWVRGHLERLGIISRFGTMQCAEDVARVKPAPDLYLAAVRELGIEPEGAVALEDSPNGCLAARAAGLRCVAVPNALTCRMPFGPVDLMLSSLDELHLSDILSRIEQSPPGD
jgi:HAD superfamily hydrolase (TIGR01509 family)